MPILMTKDEWNRIVKWTDTNKEDPEIARQREYLAFLDKKSQEMTKSWPNSLENVNKRNEEIRRARVESLENANVKFYKRYVKRKREEQERMMYSARDTIFKNKDAPKLLLNGVVESVILKEREEQIKFDNMFVGGYEREQKRLYDEMVIRKAKEWEEEQKEKKRRRFQANKEHQKHLLDQIREIDERKRKEHEEELRLQQQDIINSTKEIELIKQFEQEFKEAEKKRIWRDNEQSRKETEERRRQQAEADRMDDQLIEVLQKSQSRIEAKRRATEKEMREEQMRILDAIRKKLKNTTDNRDAKEQASLEKAVAEREAAVEARHKAFIDKKERHKREKIEAREQFLRDEAQRLHEEQTKHQWDLMNRFKNQELYAEYLQQQKEEKERKTKEYREEILKQQKEIADRNARELAETRAFYGTLAAQKFREADNKLFTYALALIDEAEKNGRPTLPIHKAIQRYCKMYRLYPMPDLPKSLQEHFKGYAPWDGTKPDPEYTEPEKPPPALDPDALDQEEDEEEEAIGGKRDGLQSLIKMTGVKPAPKPKDAPKSPMKEEKKEVEEDYKRQGRANGLQRKRESPPPKEIVLPPITMVTYPCKKLGIVSSVPLKKEQCECVLVGEI